MAYEGDWNFIWGAHSTEELHIKYSTPQQCLKSFYLNFTQEKCWQQAVWIIQSNGNNDSAKKKKKDWADESSYSRYLKTHTSVFNYSG